VAPSRLALALFNLVVADLARREYDGVPEPDEAWIVKDQVLMPEGEPRGTVVLIHGFGGSPLDYKPLALPLVTAGFRVVAPVTPGQGRDVFAHRRGEITPEILLTWLRGIINRETQKGGPKPHLVGFSMGGALSTVVASENRVDRLVLIAPFYALPNADTMLETAAEIVEPILPVVPKPWRGNIADPSVYEEYFPGTKYVSLEAFQQLEDLARRARTAASILDRPTLLLGSDNDFAASFETARGCLESRPNVTVLTFPRSDHILLYDYDRSEVIRKVVEFLTAD
jgi:alpha-beta hydrolase superfamily lysophospholipase